MRRDELLYESDAALRLVDQAIQEMQVLDDGQGEVQSEGERDAVVVAAGDVPVAAQDPE